MPGQFPIRFSLGYWSREFGCNYFFGCKHFFEKMDFCNFLGEILVYFPIRNSKSLFFGTVKKTEFWFNLYGSSPSEFFLSESIFSTPTRTAERYLFVWTKKSVLVEMFPIWSRSTNFRLDDRVLTNVLDWQRCI